MYPSNAGIWIIPGYPDITRASWVVIGYPSIISLYQKFVPKFGLSEIVTTIIRILGDTYHRCKAVYTRARDPRSTTDQFEAVGWF